jgi:ribosomal RNA-processing protein 17
LLEEAKIPGFAADSSDDEPWNGFQDDLPVKPIDHEAEYIDEDRYTTVTVEAVDISKEGLHRITDENEAEDDEGAAETKPPASAVSNVETNTKKVWPKKTKKKKFRYESKAERKVTRGKQKAGNKVKADARRGRD